MDLVDSVRKLSEGLHIAPRSWKWHMVHRRNPQIFTRAQERYLPTVIDPVIMVSSSLPGCCRLRVRVRGAHMRQAHASLLPSLSSPFILHNPLPRNLLRIHATPREICNNICNYAHFYFSDHIMHHPSSLCSPNRQQQQTYTFVASALT
jgi:hypothetical protein